MLLRRLSPNGVVYYASPTLERARVPHAFSTRIGGVSAAPFDSMNLGNPNGCAVQDDTENIRANYQLLQTAAGCADAKWCWVHQVHGADVIVANENFQSGPKADALVTAVPGNAISVRAADCVPVLVATADGACVAAVHAGWRGVVAGAVPNAVRALRGLTRSNTRLLAAVGPSIGFDAFEVGPEVVDEFARVFADESLLRRDVTPGKGRIDLRSAIVRQLLNVGVDEADIDTTHRCSFTHADEFFSHRRDNGVTGRMAAVIATTRHCP